MGAVPGAMAGPSRRRTPAPGRCARPLRPGARTRSGFAVDWDGYRLVLDLGYATLPRLLAHWPDGVLDAVAITHEHPDHCIDLHGLFRMRFYGTPAKTTTAVVLPAGRARPAGRTGAGRGPGRGLRPASAARHLPGRAIRADRRAAPSLCPECGHPRAGRRDRLGLLRGHWAGSNAGRARP